MGYLTTITFRNDAYQTFMNNKRELFEKIIKALNGNQINNGYDYFSVGNEINPVIIQKPRHTDDTTLYMHAGNTITDISNLKEFTSRNEWAINQAITEMEYHLKRLKKIKNK